MGRGATGRRDKVLGRAPGAGIRVAGGDVGGDAVARKVVRRDTLETSAAARIESKRTDPSHLSAKTPPPWLLNGTPKEVLLNERTPQPWSPVARASQFAFFELSFIMNEPENPPDCWLQPALVWVDIAFIVVSPTPSTTSISPSAGQFDPVNQIACRGSAWIRERMTYRPRSTDSRHRSNVKDEEPAVERLARDKFERVPALLVAARADPEGHLVVPVDGEEPLVPSVAQSII